MTEYLTLLRSLTDLQQRHAIQRLIISRSGAPVAEDMLKHPTVVEFNQSLGWSAYWKSETSEFGIDAIEVGSPRFSELLCTAPISFRYINLNHYSGCIVSNLEHQLTVHALVYIDEDGEPMVGTVTCATNQDEVKAEEEALSALKEDGYLNYLRALTPAKRCNAVFDLADLTWGIDNPKFLSHPQLTVSLMQSGIDLVYSEHEVGPVELDGDHGTASITYTFYGFLSTGEEEIPEAISCVEIDILACVSDRSASDSDDVDAQLTIKGLWFSIIPIEDHEEGNLMIVS